MQITEENIKDLISLNEFYEKGYQYTIMYIARIHSQAEFLFSKVILLEDKLYSKYEISEIIEAFTIKSICDWEWYIERMLCETLKNDTTKLSETLDLVLPKKISTDECFVYLNGLNYFDLKNASNLKDISKKILVDDYNPYLKISNEAKNKIDEFYIIRNYVAHKSKKSKKSLMNIYKKYDILEFRDAGEFLLSKGNENSKTIMVQDYGSAFWLSAFNILEFLYPKIYKWIVTEEKIYNEKCHLRLDYLMHLSSKKTKIT
ncbi:hypothetical protein [Flavobacterium sp.]|uniref:hypothetical protein n=1 Tax=Flavobacterium sp. TaxID=239 RepID=UPI002FDE95C9